MCLAESLHGSLGPSFSLIGKWASATLDIWAAQIKSLNYVSDALRPHLSNAIEASSLVYLILIEDKHLLSSSNMVFVISKLSE